MGRTKNEMNSDTHSCTHSFASFAILALSGRAAFMIRPTLAIYVSERISIRVWLRDVSLRELLCGSAVLHLEA